LRCIFSSSNQLFLPSLHFSKTVNISFLFFFFSLKRQLASSFSSATPRLLL
jgi:hypothetical protein